MRFSGSSHNDILFILLSVTEREREGEREREREREREGGGEFIYYIKSDRYLECLSPPHLKNLRTQPPPFEYTTQFRALTL